jgi:aerobic carbon-monoxide dehydrogenase medium subunit
MKAARFTFTRATSVGHALSLLAEAHDPLHPPVALAGGQALVPALAERKVEPSAVVALDAIADLQTIETRDDSVTIGAGVTAAAIEDSFNKQPVWSVLKRVAARTGPRAVRTRGTIGGNIAAGNPTSDWMIALTALGANVEIADQQGSSSVEVLALGRPGGSTLGRDGLLASVTIPAISSKAVWGQFALRPTAAAAAAIVASVLDDSDTFRCVVAGPQGAAILDNSEPTSAALRDTLRGHAVLAPQEVKPLLAEICPGWPAATLSLAAAALCRALLSAERI